MSNRPTQSAAALAAAVAPGASVLAVAADPILYVARESGTLRLNHGEKWATDEPPRRGMDEIRVLMTSKLAANHERALGPDDTSALGVAVEELVVAILAQCKLAPEADAVLHVLIADLLTGAYTMQDKTKDQPDRGAHKVVAALSSYGHYFKHPGWRSIGGSWADGRWVRRRSTSRFQNTGHLSIERGPAVAAARDSAACHDVIVRKH